jgi:cell division protein FtsL
MICLIIQAQSSTTTLWNAVGAERTTSTTPNRIVKLLSKLDYFEKYLLAVCIVYFLVINVNRFYNQLMTMFTTAMFTSVRDFSLGLPI